MSYYDCIKTDTVNNYYLYSRDEIDELKKRLDPGRLVSFKNDMEDLFDAPLESVITKERLAPSGDPHDYVSLATYWWPNKETPDGLPYVRNDGFVNPEGARYDKDKLKRLAYLVYHGGLLYFLSGETRYLELLKRHLHHWFIDGKTRMNPHLEYGQFVPGLSKGRGVGIIDYGASFSYALNMITLLKQQGALEGDLPEGIAAWHRAFRSWLLESEIGREEKSAGNNHGIFYDFSLSVIEMFLDMKEPVRDRVDFFIRERIEKQIAPDFSLPQETARTRSVSYSFMALKGFLETAKIFKSLGCDIFPRLKGTVDWLYRTAVVRRSSWPYPQVTPFDEGSYLLFRQLVTGIYGEEYQDIAAYTDGAKITNKALAYLYGP